MCWKASVGCCWVFGSIFEIGHEKSTVPLRGSDVLGLELRAQDLAWDTLLGRRSPFLGFRLQGP